MEFRRSLAASFLFKGLLHAAQELEREAPSSFALPFPEEYRSGVGVGRQSRKTSLAMLATTTH